MLASPVPISACLYREKKKKTNKMNQTRKDKEGVTIADLQLRSEGVGNTMCKYLR